jgi:hypothetical protein
MTTLKEVEVLAEQLSSAERIVLARRWLAENSVESLPNDDHRGVNGGAAPGSLADLDVRIARVGTVISGRRKATAPIEEDSIWGARKFSG